MIKRTLLVGLTGGMLLLSNCTYKRYASIKKAPATPEEAVAEVKAKYTASQIADGKVIWQNACTKCHSLMAPEGHSVQRWDHQILPRMMYLARLNDEEAGLVRAYVITHATRMHKRDPMPERNK